MILLALSHHHLILGEISMDDIQKLASPSKASREDIVGRFVSYTCIDYHHLGDQHPVFYYFRGLAHLSPTM